MTDKIEIRPDDKGDFDEFIAKNATVHIEMMDSKCVWIGIETEEEAYGLWFRANGKLNVFVEEQ